MNKKPVRTDPPSDSPNNQDALVFALYLLGGADKDVDVEDMFLKCHELAPARLSWRTRPDIPDYKKVSKALQSVEASTHVGLFHHTNQYSRRLTVDGNRWCETYISILERVYTKAPVQASKNTNMHERKRHEIKNSQVWVLFKESPREIGIEDFASVLQCSAASSHATWASRVQDVKRAADVLQDQELMQFAQLVELRVLNGENNI
jgi:predicted SprT family Zn-dependent metalloprotease